MRSSGLGAAGACVRLLEEGNLALDRGGKPRLACGCFLQGRLERRTRQAAERRFHRRLGAGYVVVEIAEPDEIAGKGELDDVAASRRRAP